MLIKEIKHHPFDYALLTGVSIIAMALYLAPQLSLPAKDILSLLLGFFYAGWGIWHHRRKRILSVHVALEYVIMGGLVSLVLWLTLGY